VFVQFAHCNIFPHESGGKNNLSRDVLLQCTEVDVTEVYGIRVNSAKFPVHLKILKLICHIVHL
jgi:hypothetical protein